MRFRAENLGPIRSAELDLSKKLIILAGPNNSGKTYLGWALYGLSRFTPNHELASERVLSDWLVSNPDHEKDQSQNPDLSGVFVTELTQAYLSEIHRDFAATSGSFKTSSIAVQDASIRYNHQSFITLQFIVQQRSTPGNFALNPTIETNILRAMHFGRWTIFPVERLAINIFARELSLIRMDVIDELALDVGSSISEGPLLRVGRYPRAIRDALRLAISLDSAKRSISPFADLADDFEASVLNGTIIVSETGELVFQPNKTSQPLSIHRSSSIVKSLSSIVFYLRHIAREGDHIIIDEPELNLHPDNQRRVARVLAKAVNRGLRVVLSTHSDTLIGELNNLIMLSHDPGSEATQGLMTELGYDPGSALRPEDLGVYLVHDGICAPVDVGPSGFEVRTIDEAIHKLNQDAQTIYGRLFCE